MQKEVIVVTGSCGRIGTSVVKKLGSKYKIIGFDLLKSVYAHDNEELVPMDLSSDESVHQAFHHIRHFYGNKIASVVHLAAYYSFKDQHSDLYDKVTVKGTERLIKALQTFEVEQFIFSSTMLVHAPCKLGQKIDENWPVMPTWDYPASKVRTEKLIHKIRGTIPALILRIAGVYDDQCHSIPISQQIKRIFENQLESRVFAGNIAHGAAFLHMDDLVDAIVKAVSHRKTLPPELTLLIGEETTLSYDQLQRAIRRLLFNKELKTYQIPKLLARIGSWIQCHIPFIEPPFIQPWMIPLSDNHYSLNVAKALQYLGWKPQHSIETTLLKIIEELKKDPVAWYKTNQLSLPHSLKGSLTHPFK